jgi:hypothetical protein
VALPLLRNLRTQKIMSLGLYRNH